MPNEIDNRVVQMQFDNAQFERGVSTSLGTLDKLKAALKMNGATDGFNNIQAASNKIDFSALIAGVSQAGQKFNALEIAAITAITNITNRAVNAGINLAKSLSVDQLTAGWAKYGDKAQSVNTIMAATAESVETVGEQLDKLNAYTDETSANFTDMTANIGKFTNAGVGLEDAAQAMQGITNWAYLSGASVAEAGRAMYNLSQAMAVGSVKLIDWRSIENANMATTKFKETVIATAVAMGQLVETSEEGVYHVAGNAKQLVSATNFNEQLSTGWFSSDVLSATLDKFGSFSTDIIALSQETGITVVDLMRHFKEFEKGTIDFGEVAQGTGKSAEEMQSAFRMMGSASNSIAKRLMANNEHVKGVFEGQAAMIKNATGEEVEATELLTDYLEESYNKWIESGKRITQDGTGIGKDIIKIFEEMESNQSLGVAAFRAAQEYRSLRDAIDATKDAVSTGWMKSFELLFGNAEEAKRVWSAVGDTLYEVFASGGEARNKMLQVWKDTGGYESFVRAIENVSEAIIGLKELADEVFEDSFLHIDENDVDFLVSVTKKFEDLSKVIKAITTGDISGIFDPIESSELPKLAKDLEGVNLEEVVGDVGKFNSQIETAEKGAATLASVIEGLAHAADIAKSVISGVWNAISPVGEFISSVGNDIADLLVAISSRLGFINEQDMENNGIFGFFEKIRAIVAPVAEWASGVFHTFTEALINLIDPDKESSLSDFGNTFTHIFQGIGNICNKIFPILSSIGRMIGGVIDSISTKVKEFMDNATLQDFIDLLKDGLGVGVLAGLAGAAGNVSKGTKGIREIIEAITGKVTGEEKNTNFLEGLSKTIDDFATNISESMKKMVDVKAIKDFAAAVLMLAAALFLMSLVPAEDIASRLAILTIAVTEIIGAMEIFTSGTLADSGKMLAGAAAMAIMAGGILILSAAFLVLSLIPTEKLGTGLAALTGIIVEAVAALAVLSLLNPVTMLAGAAAMLILAPAILVLSASLALLALLPVERMGPALDILAGLLAEVVVAIGALSLFNPVNMLAGASAMLIMAPALILMAAALAILAAIPADDVERAVGVLLGLMLEAVGALSVLSLVGPMCLVAAMSLLILAPAMIMFAGALLLLSAIPTEKLGPTLIALAVALGIVVAAAWAVAPVVGPLLAFAAALLVIAAATVVLGVGLSAIAIGIMLLIAAGSLLVTTIVNAFTDLIGTITDLQDSFFDIGSEIINKVIEGAKAIFTDLWEIGKEVVNGLIQSIKDGLSSIWEAGKSLGSSLLEGVKDFLGIESPSKEFMEVGDYSILGLLESIDDGLGDVAKAGKSIGETLIDSTEEALSDYDSIMDDHELKPVVDLSNIAPDVDSTGLKSLSAARSTIGLMPNLTETGSQNVRNTNPVFHIYQQPGQDSEDLARIINRELGRLLVT